jgi:hypothetical protein
VSIKERKNAVSRRPPHLPLSPCLPSAMQAWYIRHVIEIGLASQVDDYVHIWVYSRPRLPGVCLVVSLFRYLLISLSPYFAISLFRYLLISLSPYFAIPLFRYLLISLSPYFAISLFRYLLLISRWFALPQGDLGSPYLLISSFRYMYQGDLGHRVKQLVEETRHLEAEIHASIPLKERGCGRTPSGEGCRGWCGGGCSERCPDRVLVSEGNSEK